MTGWPKVVLTLGLTLAPLAAGVALVLAGEREIGMLFLGVGAGAATRGAADKMTATRVK